MDSASKYLTISSIDSLDIHPSNSNYDFTVELERTIYGQFSIALVEIFCNQIPEELYVFCDIVEPSFVHDKMLPLLRVVRQPNEFIHLHQIRSSRALIQRIRIFVLNRTLSSPQFDSGAITCTLKLTPVRK